MTSTYHISCEPQCWRNQYGDNNLDGCLPAPPVCFKGKLDQVEERDNKVCKDVDLEGKNKELNPAVHDCRNRNKRRKRDKPQVEESSPSTFSFISPPSP